MSALSRIAVLGVALAAAAPISFTAEPEVVGVWAWHTDWQDAPPEIRAEPGQGIAATASALIASFCPDGTFRLATGVFWRHDHGISLGASDGIALYRGTWSRQAKALTVRYRLVSAELVADREHFDSERKEDAVVEPIVIGEVVAFPHHWWGWGDRDPITKVFPLLPQRDFQPTLDDRFVECGSETERLEVP